MSHLTKSSGVHLAALTLSTSALLLLHLPTTWVVLRRRPRRWVRGARLHQDAVRASLGWATVLTAEVTWKEQVSVQDNMIEGNNHQTKPILTCLAKCTIATSWSWEHLATSTFSAPIHYFGQDLSVNKRNPCFFSFFQRVSKCQVFCTTLKSRQVCFEQIE